MDPHVPRARRLGGDLHPLIPPFPASHLLSLWPVVTHCSSVRVVGTRLLAMLGSTLRQYSVTQNRSLMVNSALFSSTLNCNRQSTGWHLRAPSSCFPPSSSSLSPGGSPQGVLR